MKQIFLILLLVCFANISKAVLCDSLFGDSELYRSIHALAELRLQLDFAQTNNEDSITISLLRAKCSEKEKILLSYVTQSKLMSAEELREKIKSEIKEVQKKKKTEDFQINLIREDVDAAILRTVFNRIEPGKFLMGPRGSQREVEIEQPFEMMSTTLTQAAWRELATLVAKHGFAVPDVLFVNEGDLVPFHGWSWRKVISFIDAINSVSKTEAKNLRKILLGHKDGDQYDLPTEKEWEFVARARGRFEGEYPYDDPISVDTFAWHSRVAHNGFQEVAQKTPISFEGMEFFDMLGNIREWTKDLKDGRTSAITRGNQIFGLRWDSSLSHRSSKSIDGASYIGIRLVRRLK